MNNLSKKAFTIIELLVVLATLGIIFIVGATGIFRLRQALELQNAFGDVKSIIRTAQNNARNSLAFTELTADEIPRVPDLYAVYFSNNNYSFLDCQLNGAIVNCESIQKDIKPEAFPNIQFEWRTGCGSSRAIAFTKSLGELVTIQGGNVIEQPDRIRINGAIVRDVSTCDFAVIHSETDSERLITLNLESNFLNFDQNDL